MLGGPTSTSCEQGLGLTSADKQSRREDGLPSTTMLIFQNLGRQDSDPVFYRDRKFLLVGVGVDSREEKLNALEIQSR